MRTFLLASAALLWGGTALAEDLPTSTSLPSAMTIPAPAASLPSEEQPMVSQGNPAWRWMKLGSTTIGRAGCLVTSLYDTLITSKLLSSSTDLGSFVRLLSAYGLFTPSGDLRWDIGKLFPVTVQRITAFGAAALDKAASALSDGTYVLIELATKRGTHHWVRVSRIVNGDAEIRDPNGGRIEWLDSTYGVKAVQGMALITAQ